MSGGTAVSHAHDARNGGHAATSQLRAAVATPASWVGFTGSLVVSVAASARGSAGDSTWLPGPYAALREALPALTASALTVAGVALLVLAWWLARPGMVRPDLGMRLVLALWVLPLAVCPLVLSVDAYGYADLGWTLLHGLDPYTTGLRATGSPYVPGVPASLEGVRWGYPGLGIAVNGWAAALTGFHPYWVWSHSACPRGVGLR